MKFKLVEITSKSTTNYKGPVHDLTVDEDHSYTINKIIVHNSICKTRIQTGFGIPTLQSVIDASLARSQNNQLKNVAIIADGGIRYPSDIVKAIAAGADAVMCGRIFAATDETPGDLIHDEIAGVTYKTYRGMACYSSDTEVLTSGGWKLFSELGSEDKVATLNQKTKNIEYDKPIKIFDYEYSGDMYYIESRSVDLAVTPNHNLYVGKRNHHRDTQYSLIRADEAYSKNNKYQNYNYRLHGNWHGDSIESYTIPNSNLSFKMNEWLDFYGFWLAEGCTYQYKQKKMYTCNVTSISNNDLSLIRKYRDILSRSGIKSSIRSRKIRSGKTNYELKAHNKELYNYLSKFGKAKDKFISREYKDLPADQLNVIIDSIFLGDGSKSRGSISTVSKKLADDISELCIKTNRNGKVQLARLAGISYKNFNRNHNLYNISVMRDSAKETFVSSENVKIEKYAGKVYCVEVENSVICVRRNGKYVWCGNSKEVQQDHRGGLKPMTCAEGVSTRIPVKGPVSAVIDEFAGGLRSGMTYANAKTLVELRNNAKFIRITSSGLDESHAFGTRK